MFLSQNQISVKTRLKELFIDYLVILVYLLILLAWSMIFYYFLWGIPKFREFEYQIIATSTSVIPIILIFSYFDYNWGTLWKRYSGLKVYFEKKSFLSSLLEKYCKIYSLANSSYLYNSSSLHRIFSNFNNFWKCCNNFSSGTIFYVNF